MCVSPFHTWFTVLPKTISIWDPQTSDKSDGLCILSPIAWQWKETVLETQLGFFAFSKLGALPKGKNTVEGVEIVL